VSPDAHFTTRTATFRDVQLVAERGKMPFLLTCLAETYQLSPVRCAREQLVPAPNKYMYDSLMNDNQLIVSDK